MADPSDDEPDARVLDDAEYVKVLNTRSDIFSIEGDGSLRAIGLLAVFFGICFGIGMRFAQHPFVRPPHLYSQNEGNAGFDKQVGENPSKRAPAPSAQKIAANRNPVKLLSHSRVGGAKTGTTLASQ